MVTAFCAAKKTLLVWYEEETFPIWARVPSETLRGVSLVPSLLRLQVTGDPNYYDFGAMLGYGSLEDSVELFKANNALELTRLVPDLKGVDPDDAFRLVEASPACCRMHFISFLFFVVRPWLVLNSVRLICLGMPDVMYA